MVAAARAQARAAQVQVRADRDATRVSKRSFERCMRVRRLGAWGVGR